MRIYFFLSGKYLFLAKIRENIFTVVSHLDVLHGSEGSEELPQDVLLGLRGEVVHEDAPARPVASRHSCI